MSEFFADATYLAAGRAIAPRRQAPLPPFDTFDGENQVHTVLPPELVIPKRGTDPAFLVGDGWGVTIPGETNPPIKKPDGSWNYLAIIANGGVHITTGRWAGLWIPFLIGANSTPPTQLMTAMLPLYPRDVQQVFLTEYLERDYDHILTAANGWNMPENGYPENDVARMVAWHEQLKSRWDLRPVFWQGNYREGITPVLRALMDAKAIDYFVYGKEVDAIKNPDGSSEEYEAALRQVDAFIGGRVRIGVHFTADADRQMGYPTGMTRETYINNWSEFDGRVDLMQQLPCEATAGRQGASMYYARKHVNLGEHGGGDAAKGKGAPNSRVCAFETMATWLLYGLCTEEQACLRSYELLCGTRDNPKVWPVSGSMGGLRLPNGDSIFTKAA